MSESKQEKQQDHGDNNEGEKKDPRAISIYEKKEDYECVLTFPQGLLDPVRGPEIAAEAAALGTVAAHAVATEEGGEQRGVSKKDASPAAAAAATIVPARQEDMKLGYIDKEWLGSTAVVVHKAFSPSECQVMIDYCEGKLTAAKDLPAERLEDPRRYGLMIPAVRTTNHRNNFRVEAMAEEAAAMLFGRVKPFLQELGQEEIVISDSNFHLFEDQAFGIKGTWKATGINPCFRICKYNPDGHFAPHCDGHFMRDYNCRSLKTFMIYLNDDYQLGTTNFLESHSLYFDEATSRYKAPREAVRARLKAQQGDILLFDHNLLHEGETVKDGVKYIMRAEVMYERHVPTPESLENATEEEKEAAAARLKDQQRMEKGYLLLREASTLEGELDFNGAVAKYRAAFKIAPELEKTA